MRDPQHRAADNGQMESPGSADTGVSRRDFLRIAGIAGATAGLGVGLGGLVTACGGEATTTTAATTQTTGAPGSSTTVSVAAEIGRQIKIGFVTPTTGRLALFGVPDKYCVDRWNEFAKDGVACGDGKTHPVNILVRDSQSDSNRAAQVAGDLINNEKVDLLLVASTPDTTIPVSDQAEANGVPCISVDTPWQSWFMGRNGDPKVGFKWTYHAFWGTEDLINLYFGMWDQFPNNKVYGALWPNDADGNAYRKNWPKAIEERGYKLVDAGSFEDGLEDYTKVIQIFKGGGVEICAGVLAAPDFTNFWKQAKQQSFAPKAVTVGKALQFYQVPEALGDIAIGLTSGVYWSPNWPFKSSLTGETCQQFGDEFEKRTSTQWTQPLYHYALFEFAVDSLKRAKNIDDKESIIGAVGTMKLETLMGPVDFTAPVAAGSLRPVKNVYRTPAGAGQWVKGTKHKFDLVVTSNAGWEMIPVQAKTTSLT